MKLMKTSILLLVVLFLGSIAMPPSVHAQQSQNITLAGYKMKPRVATSASGVADITLDSDTLTIGGEVSDLMNSYSGAYIMVNIRGEGGNKLYSLTVDLNDQKTGGTFPAEDNRFVLSPSEKALLKKGELFITVNTYEHQRGEIRGDIAAMHN